MAILIAVVISLVIGFLSCLLIVHPTVPTTDYVLHGFGVFLGIIAGVAIMLMVGWLTSLRQKKKQVRNLIFEFKLNIKKIDDWLQECTKFRNAINGGTLNRYYSSFQFSRFVIVTADRMFRQGELYALLDYEDIGKLQEVTSYYALYSDTFINQKINELKVNPNRTEATSFADFIEGKLSEHKKVLQLLIKKLKKKR